MSYSVTVKLTDGTKKKFDFNTTIDVPSEFELNVVDMLSFIRCINAIKLLLIVKVDWKSVEIEKT